jgi:hypothetical protein
MEGALSEQMPYIFGCTFEASFFEEQTYVLHKKPLLHMFSII